METIKWPQVSLGEICNIQTGRTPRRDQSQYWGGNNIWITIRELDGKVINDSKEYISDLAVKQVMPKPLPTGTLLFSFKLSIGKMGVTGCPLYTNEAIAGLIIKDSDKVYRDFLRYALMVSSHESGANTAVLGKVLNKQKVAEIKIPLPPLTEQARIVRLLDDADALRQLRARADTRMAAFIPALFHEMFGDPVSNEKEWPLVLVSSFVRGFEAGKSILTDGTENPKSQYRVLKVSAVTWKNYQPEESKPVPPDYHPLMHHIVRNGDLLFSRANTTQLVGATAFVFETPPNILLPDKLWRFVWEEPLKVDPLFVWSLFLHPSIRYELGSRATGTSGSMKNISMQKVLSMKVILPPLPLQHEFAARVQEARAIQAQQAAGQARLAALFQAMLARAFAGAL